MPRSRIKIEEQRIKYIEYIKVIDKLGNIARDVFNGKPEAQACREYGVSPMTYRNFLNFKWFKEIEEKDGSELEKKHSGYRFSCWEDEFMYDLLGNDGWVIPEFDEIYGYIVTFALSDRQRTVLEMYYKKDMTQQEIADYFGVTKSRIGEIINRALFKLRNRKCINMFLYGERGEQIKAEENEMKRKVQLYLTEHKDKTIQLQEVLDALKEKIDGSIVEELEEFSIYNKSIDELELSVRSYNCLVRRGIHTIGELVSLTYGELICIRNLGRRSVEEIIGKLDELGLSLKE